jgi:hypothetical protein
MSSALGPSNQASVRQLASSDDATIKAITDGTIKVLLEQASRSHPAFDGASSHAGLATLLALNVRQGTVPESVQSTLKDLGFSAGSIAYITDAYRKNVDVLRADIANIALHYGRVIGCDWRLDYQYINSESGPVRLPIFYVKLNLEGGENIDFSCTEEELTALVASLKDAATEAAKTAK